MVLERLVSIREALRNPLWVFVIGGIVSIACLLVSFVVFPDSIGLYTTFLITISMTPFMINLATYDESLEEATIKKRINQNLLQRHKGVLIIYAAFFSGMILSFSIIFLMLPHTIVEKLFSDQVQTIQLIRGNVTFFNNFEKILFNNIGVLLISFLFSFIFGAGAIFVLTWNATILSTAIGMTAKTIGGFVALPFAMLYYFPHGSLEILAYFIGAVAGGIVSAAISKRHTEWLKVILKDSAILLCVAIFILILAAVIESFSMIEFIKL